MLVAQDLHEDLNTVFRCVRPIFCKSPVEGHELFGRGSGFVVRAAGAVWIATAAHVLNDKPFSDLAVPRFIPHGTAPVGEFFQPIGLAGVNPDDEEDTAGFDVAMIRTNETEHPDALNLENPSFLAPLESATRGDPVRLGGFPASLDNLIDGESGAIRIQVFRADGEYDGPATSAHLHRFTITDIGKVTDLNGMMKWTPSFRPPRAAVKAGPASVSFLS